MIKYDPLSQREFYQFFSFFNNVPETGRLAGQSSNTKPLVNVETAEHRASVAKWKRRLNRPRPPRNRRRPSCRVMKVWAPKFSEIEREKVIWQGVDEATVTSRAAQV